MRAAIYCRLSQDRDGTQKKVDEQEADCREIAARRGWEVLDGDVLVDNDLSAWSGVRRPGFEQLLERLRERAVDAVVVWHPDRLIRQPRDLEALLDLAQQRGVQLASAGGGRDLSNPDDVFILRIETAHACRSSDDTSRRVKKGHLVAAQRGTPGGGGIRPFGYAADRLTLVDDEADVIREAADRVLAGESLQAVAGDFAARSIPTVRGGRWDPTTLRTALLRPRVAGLREHKGEIIGKASWPPILTEDTWRELRVMCDARRQGPSRSVSYWLSGTATCGVCQAPMIGSPRGDGVRRYACVKRRGGCGGVVRLAEPVEDLVGDVIVRRMSDLGDLAEPETGSEWAAAIERDQAFLVELSRRWGQGALSTEEYDAARGPVDARLREARRRVPPPSLAAPLVAEQWATGTPEWRKRVARMLIASVRIDRLPPGAPMRLFDPRLLTVAWR